MKRLACTILLIAALGACVPQHGAPTSPPSSGTPTTAPPAVRPQNGSTVWTTRAAGLPTSSRSADWASRIYNYADVYDKDFVVKFGLDAPSNDYSVPVYDAADATGTIRVFWRPVNNWPGRFDVPVGSSIPWNPDWRPADGRDGHMAIVNSTTGEEWNLWAVATPEFHPTYLTQIECLQSLDNILGGFDTGNDMCAAAVLQVADPSGTTVDTRTYRGNYPPSTEIGIQQTSGLATPAEVASGNIGHALRFAVSPAASMTGPVCPPDVTTPNDPRVGTTCGIAVAPGGKFDSSSIISGAAALAKQIPRGTRFVLDISDAEIEQWLDSRGYSGTIRSTARTFAKAMRDYGLIITMTSGGPATIPASGGRNPQTAAGWRSLGIADEGRDLLNGLVTQPRIRVLDPPTNRCNGVATKLACFSTDTSY